MKLIDQLWNECKNQLTLEELDQLVANGFAEKNEAEALIFQQLKDVNLSAKNLIVRLESLKLLRDNSALLDKFAQESENPLFKEYMNFSFAELLRRRGLSSLPHLWEIIILQKVHSPQWNECKNQLTLDELDWFVSNGIIEKDETNDLIFQRLKDIKLSTKDLITYFEKLQMFRSNPELLDQFVKESNNQLFKEYINFSFTELLCRRKLSPLPYLWEVIILQKFCSQQQNKVSLEEMIDLYKSDLTRENRNFIITHILLKNSKPGWSIKELFQKLITLGNIGEAIRLILIESFENPAEFECLYHEEQALTPGEYFWLWVRYIENKIEERDTKINEGHRDEVLPLDEFVRGLNAPPAILCEVFFRGDSCNADYKFPGNCGRIYLGWEFEGRLFRWSKAPQPTFEECTFEDYLRWFSSGVMQFVRTIWEYEIPFRIAPDYRFFVAYKDRIPEICQAMIDAIKTEKLLPKQFSFGFLNMPDTEHFFDQIQNENLFQELPERLLKFCIYNGPLGKKPWGDFCSLLPAHAQMQNLSQNAKLSELCANCPFPCIGIRVPITSEWEHEGGYYGWDSIPECLWGDYEVYCRNNKWSAWCRCENFAYIQFDYVCSAILKNDEMYLYLHNEYYDDNIFITNHNDQDAYIEFQANLQAEEEDRLYYPEYYRPGKCFGRRHHGGGGGLVHKAAKTSLDVPTLEKRVQAAFKKWDKALEPLVQTVVFLTNHVISAQGRDVSTWQTAADWLFEVNEKRLSEAVAKLETSQMVKLTQLCGRLPWSKLRELLTGPIDLCKGECVAPFKELIHGTDEPLSETAQGLLENKAFVQVWHLAIGWSKIC